MNKANWSEKVTKEEVLEHIREKRMLLNNILRSKASYIGHTLRRNFFLHYSIVGQMTELKRVGRRRRIRRQLLDDLGKRRYFHLKEEADDGKGWKRQFVT